VDISKSETCAHNAQKIQAASASPAVADIHKVLWAWSERRRRKLRAKSDISVSTLVAGPLSSEGTRLSPGTAG
jgi:hypothetical protein